MIELGYLGTRYVSTYLHGPLGPIARTAEYDDNDVTDNRDIYYLRDAMGGHTGLLMDHDDDLSTPSRASFATYDAFGNGMSPGTPSALGGSFAWRGAEGSVYDSAPTLVYMQARHYDPTIGRFIQPDTLALASLSTQGMNRYIYCENDPVSKTDPTGRTPLIFLALIGGLLAGLMGMIAGALRSGTMQGALIGFAEGFAVAFVSTLLMAIMPAPFAFAFGTGYVLGISAKLRGGNPRMAFSVGFGVGFVGGLFLAGFNPSEIFDFLDPELWALWLIGTDVGLVGDCILSESTDYDWPTEIFDNRQRTFPQQLC